MKTQLEPSIVRIRKHNGTVIGAGFLVSEKYVLTCAHVVAQSLGIPAKTPVKPEEEVILDFPTVEPGETLKARVVVWREVQEDETAPPPEDGEDIAVLKLETPLPAGAKPAPLLSKNDLEGHQFEAFGFPDGHDNGVWASGVLCRRQGAGWVQIEAEKEPGFRVEPGFSGTPIWDKKLKGVVGIAVAADLERLEAKVAFMIPTELLVKAWFRLGEWTIPPLLPGGKKLFRFWRDRPWAWVSLLLIPFLGATLFSTPQVREEFGIGQPRCIEIAHKQKKLVIAITNFYKSQGIKSNDLLTEERLLDRLEGQRIPDVEICRINQTISTRSDAQRLGKKLGAALVIWGRQDKSVLEVFLKGVNQDIRYLTSLSVRSADASDSQLQIRDWPELLTVMSSFALSEIYRSGGQILKARQTLKEALEQSDLRGLDKANKRNTKILAQAYFFLGLLFNETTKTDCDGTQEDCRNALRAYEQASELDGERYEALLSQGVIYWRLQDPIQASKKFTQIIESGSNSPSAVEARMYRANISLERGNGAAAVEDLKVICQLPPDDPMYCHYLGLAQLQVGQLKEAEQTYQDIKRYLDRKAKAGILDELRSLSKEKPKLAPIINTITAKLQ